MPVAQPARGSRGQGHAKIAAGRFVLSARWVVPVEPAGAVLEHHAVAVSGGRIEKVFPAAPAAQLPAQFRDYERVELPGHALLPGLVNAHTHAAMALMRGRNAPAWPAPPPRLSPEFARDGTLLACDEMLRGGITCFGDSFFFPEAALEAALASGMRSAVGLAVIDSPNAYASDPADYLRKGLALRDRYREHALVSFYLAPDSPQAVSDAILRQVATLAAELDLPVHLRLRQGGGELERAQRHGLPGPGLTAVHAVHVDPAGIALLARHGCSVAHCALASVRRPSGPAPLEAMRKAGINLCLGTDAPPGNHRLDLFAEMRASPLPAHDVLRAATLGGARALGLGDRIGSIEPGKSADLVAVALRAPEAAPWHDPAAHLAYAAGREDVTHVWVDGELRVYEGNIANPVLSGLDTRWELWQNALRGRADS